MEEMEFEVPSPDFQGITFWLGDGLPVTLNDKMAGPELREYIEDPLQRKVLAVRLKWALDWLG